jgi:DNA-binding transcriptional MocR family regulator
MSRIDIDILTEDARAALLELARLLGRIAAEDALDHSIPYNTPPQSQKKGTRDDKQ